MVNSQEKLNFFISRAKEKHGNTNDYSKVKYLNATTHVLIICRLHGEYMQNPTSHIAGNLGCAQCSSLKKSKGRTQNPDWFIPAANKVHDNKFDYSKFSYINKKTKGTVLCRKHGEFSIDPEHHVNRKQGCSKCAKSATGNRRDTKASFISKSIKVHGKQYNYDKVLYNGGREIVIINCPKHSDFQITPSSHLKGGGCKECLSEHRSIRQSKGIEQFIREAKEVHGDFFDYSKFEYVNSSTKGILICRKHKNIFEQAPSNHLQGSNGCKPCRSGTLKEFIERANTIHDYAYDYSKFVFKNKTTKGTIICPKHGEFLQEPNKHTIEGRGCKKCSADKQRKGLPTFIAQAMTVHKGFYNYEQAVYIGARKKLTITCPRHGSFSCSPDNHLRGKGCPKCTGKSQEQFILDAVAIHGEKYNYSKVKYEDGLTKVTIICPIHGDFKKAPSSHISSGVGCPRCSQKYAHCTTEEWIAFAIKKHSHKYDYSKTIYTRGKDTVIIICPEHGEFTPSATSHVSAGSGCPKCANMAFGKTQGQARLKSTRQFIEEANLLHAEANYDYSKTVYTGADKEVIITCPEHGDFIKTATKHIHSLQGCPTCSYLRGYNKSNAGCLYILESSCSSLIKIGISNNLAQRTKELRKNQKLNDFTIIKAYWHDNGSVPLSLEGKTHNLGDRLNLRGFKQPEFVNIFGNTFDGYTEWFKKDERLIKFIDEEFNKIKS